jgi:hypothetical protein
MTWFRLVYLQCDTDGCTNHYLGTVHDEGMRVTREKAAQIGWKVWEGRDYCPDHADTGIPRARIRTVTNSDN